MGGRRGDKSVRDGGLGGEESTPHPACRPPSPTRGEGDGAAASVHVKGGIVPQRLLPLREKVADRPDEGFSPPTAPSTPHRLIPAPSPHAILPSSRAPKRDHDEWLVRWEVGWFGSRPGPGRKYLGMGRFAGQAAGNARGARCGAPQGAGPPRMRWPGEVVMRVDARSPAAHAPRDAARDAPGPWYHKPKTPIGRRGASLIQLRTTRARSTPRRPRFTAPQGAGLFEQPEAGWPAGASARPQARNRQRPRSTLVPAYFAAPPNCSSIRISWLYLASRSERDSEPVLICPQLQATARSAIVESSVSPER